MIAAIQTFIANWRVAVLAAIAGLRPVKPTGHIQCLSSFYNSITPKIQPENGYEIKDFGMT